MRRGQTVILNLVAVLALGGFLWLAEGNFDGYKIQILNLIAINIILALSLNLIYGFTGLFSLGHDFADDVDCLGLKPLQMGQGLA